MSKDEDYNRRVQATEHAHELIDSLHDAKPCVGYIVIGVFDQDGAACTRLLHTPLDGRFVSSALASMAHVVADAHA